jgi:hypothetical protein
VILVTVAVLVLIWAIKPKFNLPESWKRTGEVAALPRSMLFYSEILGVSPGRWADAFIQKTGKDGKALKKHYTKCYIGEAYLVAGKVATKLRLADCGIGVLWLAMVILLLFFLLFAATEQLVPMSNTVQ